MLTASARQCSASSLKALATHSSPAPATALSSKKMAVKSVRPAPSSHLSSKSCPMATPSQSGKTAWTSLSTWSPFRLVEQCHCSLPTAGVIRERTLSTLATSIRRPLCSDLPMVTSTTSLSTTGSALTPTFLRYKVTLPGLSSGVILLDLPLTAIGTTASLIGITLPSTRCLMMPRMSLKTVCSAYCKEMMVRLAVHLPGYSTLHSDQD